MCDRYKTHESSHLSPVIQDKSFVKIFSRHVVIFPDFSHHVGIIIVFSHHVGNKET